MSQARRGKKSSIGAGWQPDHYSTPGWEFTANVEKGGVDQLQKNERTG